MRFVFESGRRVAVHRMTAGTEKRVVVLCHGAPGSGLFDPGPMETRARNVRLIGVDRPGYGGSHSLGVRAWSTVASAADDLAAVLENMNVERAGVAGWSAGGRVALALAARRPDLVDRVVVLGTPAPDDEIPWVDPEQRDELEVLRGVSPEQAHAVLRARLDSVVPEDPHSPETLWLLGAGSGDETALDAPGVRRRLGEMLGAAFAQGSRGLAADIAGYCLQPWGFEPEAVQGKTLLLYGSRDPVAGPRHGRWWQSRLPDARLEVAPEAGSLLVIPMWRRVLSHLLPDRTRLRLVHGQRDDASAEGVEEFSAA